MLHVSFRERKSPSCLAGLSPAFGPPQPVFIGFLYGVDDFHSVAWPTLFRCRISHMVDDRLLVLGNTPSYLVLVRRLLVPGSSGFVQHRRRRLSFVFYLLSWSMNLRSICYSASRSDVCCRMHVCRRRMIDWRRFMFDDFHRSALLQLLAVRLVVCWVNGWKFFWKRWLGDEGYSRWILCSGVFTVKRRWAFLGWISRSGDDVDVSRHVCFLVGEGFNTWTGLAVISTRGLDGILWAWVCPFRAFGAFFTLWRLYG